MDDLVRSCFYFFKDMSPFLFVLFVSCFLINRFSNKTQKGGYGSTLYYSRKKHYNDNYNMDNDFKKLSSTSSLND